MGSTGILPVWRAGRGATKMVASQPMKSSNLRNALVTSRRPLLLTYFTYLPASSPGKGQSSPLRLRRGDGGEVIGAGKQSVALRTRLEVYPPRVGRPILLNSFPRSCVGTQPKPYTTTTCCSVAPCGRGLLGERSLIPFLRNTLPSSSRVLVAAGSSEKTRA